MSGSPSLLVDIALSYVHLSAPNYNDESNNSLLHDAFEQFLIGHLPRPHLVSLLQHTIGTLQPLERIESILQVSTEPAASPHREPSPDPSAGRRKPRPWSPYEDTRLTAAVYRFGLDNWASVAGFVGRNRTRAQCSQRWVRGLDPRISKGQWSTEDDERLIALVRAHGSHTWSQISADMGNRSDVQCRYHFFQMYREGRLPPDVAAMAPSERPPVLPNPILLRRPGEPPRLPVGGLRPASSVGQMSLARPVGPGFDCLAEAKKQQKSRRGSLPAQSDVNVRPKKQHDSDGELGGFDVFGTANPPKGGAGREFNDWGSGLEDSGGMWTWW